MVERAIAGERGVGHFSMGGVPRIGAFRPVSSETENWFIGIIAPLSESAMSNIPGGLFIIGMIALVMSVIAALLGSMWLKRPYVEVDRLRREAEIASISKSTFLANMSHEIRTPMNSIVGFSELAMDGDISEKTKDYLEKIMANAEWLLQIINDILDISKIESGKMELEKIPFDIHEMFASCRTLIMPKAVEKGIMLHFYAEPSLGKKPLGDPTRLRQVFVNLLSNAVKFTNSGMVKLYSEILEKNDDSIKMRFEIRDSGIGMTAEQMDKIFSPFTQAESGTTRKYGGTGLGLTITKNIVEMMGGNLAVESSPGVGSKFSFELVFDTIDVTGDEAFENKIILHDFEKPSFEGEVLLCEDNAMNQQVICEHLARVGLKTVVAENGKAGVDLVRERQEKGEKQFDLILMDMHMPVMDGLEASSQILALETGIPIVALTANIMSNDREIYRDHGMFDCVGKPFTSQELWRCLMKYLTPLSVADTSKGVQLEADTDFMKNIKIMFYKNNLNKYEELVKALEENDIKVAHRIVHTLKSNAGQIGKAVLQKVAAVIEKQLKDGKNKVSAEQLKIFETELVMVLNEIAPMAEEDKDRKNTVHSTVFLGREKALEVLNALEPLVKSGNPDSLNFINEISMIRDGEELAGQIENFEFDKAYATLAKLIERMVESNE
jgi:signal transduction histidine kinase/DNA-binding response OmpR family regulator